jgi:hypothetical protein
MESDSDEPFEDEVETVTGPCVMFIVKTDDHSS